MNVIVGRGAELHREESPRAGAGPGANHLVDCREDLYAGYSLGISGNLSILRYEHAKARLSVIFSSLIALLLAFNWAPLPGPVSTEVVATRAGSPAPGTDVRPPQQERPPPPAPAPAPALAGEHVRA